MEITSKPSKSQLVKSYHLARSNMYVCIYIYTYTYIFLLFIEYYTCIRIKSALWAGEPYVAYHSVSSHVQLFLSNCVTFLVHYFSTKRPGSKTQSESLELEAKSSSWTFFFLPRKTPFSRASQSSLRMWIPVRSFCLLMGVNSNVCERWNLPPTFVEG